jgi:hypothetical protein
MAIGSPYTWRLDMNLGKGLAFSAVGALAGAVVWIILVNVTGWSLWVLAPIVGGAAGFGMMRATQMKGGTVAGVCAAAVTLVAILGARYFIVSQVVQEHLTLSDEDAFAILEAEVAGGLEQRGVEVYDEEGGYTAAVRRQANTTWSEWTEDERRRYIAAQQGETNEAAAVLTPLGLLFDFGIFGTICAVLATGTAFKTGSITLEQALVDKGLAVGKDDATALAAKMRTEDSALRGAKGAPGKRGRDEEPAMLASSGGQWSIPMRAADERPLPKIRIASSEDGSARKDDGQDSGRQVA